MSANIIKLDLNQQALVDVAGSNSIFGEAVAGSGKTTTALMAVARMRGYVSVTAYNKAAAVEFSRKARELGLSFNPQLVRFGTAHSFGLNPIKRTWPGVRFGKDAADAKYDRTVVQLNIPRGLQGFTMKLLSLGKQSAIGLEGAISDDKLWYDIIEHHDLAYEIENEAAIAQGVELAQQAAQLHLDWAPEMVDFDDMIWVPVVHGLRMFQVDNLVVDEFQDTNRARRALYRRMLRRNGHALLIGDRHQAIYGFTGADANAVDIGIREFGCHEMPLTVSYRCPKRVVEEARVVVNHIQAHEGAADGAVYSINYEGEAPSCRDSLMGMAKYGALCPDDAILCRKTRPLVETAFALIRRGVACHVEGRDIGLGLVKLVNRFAARTVKELLRKIEDYGQRESAKLIAKGKETQAENLMDRVETVMAIAKTDPASDTVDELRTRITSMFVDTGADGEEQAKPTLTLATVHRAKGREWDRVFILGRYQYMPSPWARQDWQLDQENNLIYVAVTRSKNELVYVNMPPEE